MSEPNWTPEPWTIAGPSFGGPLPRWFTSILQEDDSGGDDDVIAELADWPGDRETQNANAQRIVTCVNACTGAPSTIQPGATKAMAEALESVLDGNGLEESSMDPDLGDEIRRALALYHGQGDKP